MKTLSNIFSWLFLIASVAFIYHVYNVRYIACEDALEYVIGDIDPRFNIGQKEFQSVVEGATKVWEESIGKDLFVYNANEKEGSAIENFLKKYIDKYYTRQPIVINLIYDERQEISNEYVELSSKIDDTKKTADEIKREFQSLQDDYTQTKAEYESMLVNYRKGQVSRQALENKVNEINRLVDEINSRVKKYNYLVREVNTTVSVINQNAGEFEEGEYVSDENGEAINIYEFQNRQDLLRVMAHEFGHALGMEHNENPNSIMYYLNNKSASTQPTAEDLGAYKEVCMVE